MLPTLLLTRPLDDSRKFLARVEAVIGRPVPAVLSPLMAIVPTGAVIPEFETAVLTSANAARVVGEALRGRNTWCVGAETAAAAKAVGASVRAAGGMVSDLIARLRRDPPLGAVYFRGAVVATDLAAELGIPECVVYRQDFLPPSDGALALLASPVAVVAPVFSRRSAEALKGLVEKSVARVHIIAMSAAIAGVFDDGPAVAVADAPGGDEMVAAVAKLLAEEHDG